MILLVADALDAQARWLAGRWKDYDARILTASDLSKPGWSFEPSSAHRWTGIAGGLPCRADDQLIGLLNLLPEITQDQLLHIIPEDRAYIAHEMNAFLLSWETELTCPMLNRPTPNCLVGPNMSSEEWVLLAARLGQPVRAIARSSHGIPRSPLSNRFHEALTVTVIGERVFGDDDDLQSRARSLAREVGVDLATFYFSAKESLGFIGASLRPELANHEAADAMLHFFQEFHPC